MDMGWTGWLKSGAMILGVVMTCGAASSSSPPAVGAPAGYSGHGVQSVSATVLDTYAPVPPPAELKRRIQSMLDVRSPGQGQITPDGKTLLFSWNVTGTMQVWRVDGPRQFPVQMTGGEDVTQLMAITPDGRWGIVSRDRAGEENPGLYLLDPKGGPLLLIQHKPGVQTRFQIVSDDSRFLYYAANDIQLDSYAIYRFDLAARTAELVFDQDGLWSVDDLAADGRLLLGKDTGALSREYYEFEPAKKTLRPLLGQGELEEYAARYGSRPGELVVQTNKLGEFRRLYRWNKGGFTPLTPDVKMDVESFVMDRARTRIYVMLNDGGYTRMRVLDAKTGAELQLPPFPGADHVTAGVPSRDGRYVPLAVNSARSPRTSYVYDWKTRKLTQWVVGSSPEVDTSRFAVPTLETYPARDGTPIPMFVRRPVTCEEPCPVVVHFHGGPEGQALPGFNPVAQLFVDAGFVYVEPNVRGSDGYGKTWLRADDGAKRLNIITDIEDCVRFIRRAWAKDGTEPRVGIRGGSYGGYSVLMGMSLFAGAYDVGVSNVGISNLQTFLRNTAPYCRITRISEYGDPDRDADVLRTLSPVTYIDRVKAPLLILQGASDPRVPVGEALQMHDALVKRGVPVRLVIFRDEGHGTRKRDNQVVELGSTLDFFETHLKARR